MVVISPSLHYWFAHHPTVVNFRWDHEAWGSSWMFLAFSLLCYVMLIQVLKILLMLRMKPVPLGPVPALYNFLLLFASSIMFVGCCTSTRVEIKETRWLWRRNKAEWEWMLCFPLGTRSAGRIFFWSYIFYLSKLYEFLGTLILVLKKRNPSAGHVLRHAMSVLACFLCLQFSQSLQILTVLTNTGLYVFMYLYFFLCSVGLAPQWRSVVRRCQIVQFAVMVLASLGLLGLHFVSQGCNGMGAWFFSTALNAGLLPLVVMVDRRRQLAAARVLAGGGGVQQESARSPSDVCPPGQSSMRAVGSGNHGVNIKHQ